MKGPRTVKVAVRHRAGDTGRPRTRSAGWATRDFRLVRPAVGRDRVELECPVCAVAVLAEVRDHGRTRRVRTTWRAVSLFFLAVFAVSLAYAVRRRRRCCGCCPAGRRIPCRWTPWPRWRRGRRPSGKTGHEPRTGRCLHARPRPGREPGPP
ncbi:hypothetical protein ABZ372_51330, partial [Streptomyces sp. NPDC005921]